MFSTKRHRMQLICTGLDISTGWDVAMYISSLFFLYLIFSLSFLLVKTCNEGQRLLIMSIIEIYLFNIKEEKKRIKRKKKKHEHLSWKRYNNRFLQSCLLKSFWSKHYLSRHLFFIYLFFIFWRPGGVSNKTSDQVDVKKVMSVRRDT